MQTIPLPRTDLAVSPLALGTAEWRDDGSADRLYSVFREAGGNVFDSAHCYAFWLGREGASERALGRCVAKYDRREDVVVCTKGGHPDGGDAYRRPDRFLSPAVLAGDVRDSLDRLGVATIDLYYLHRDDPRVPVGEVIDALDELRRAGSVRHYAASNWSPARFDAANAYADRAGKPRFVAMQTMWSLADRVATLPADMCEVDAATRVWHEGGGVPLFAYSPTAGGFFGGKSKAEYESAANRKRRAAAVEIATKYGVSPTAVALAWLMRQSFLTVPILGTTSEEHLHEALRATELDLGATDRETLAFSLFA